MSWEGWVGASISFDFARRVGPALHAFDLVGRPELEPFRMWSHDQTSLGGTATYIFFFISGLLVTQSLLRSRSIASYARNRALRIFPALVVVVICRSGSRPRRDDVPLGALLCR